MVYIVNERERVVEQSSFLFLNVGAFRSVDEQVEARSDKLPVHANIHL